jgi:hypothetical protein
MTLTVASYGDLRDDFRQPPTSRNPRPCVI